MHVCVCVSLHVHACTSTRGESSRVGKRRGRKPALLRRRPVRLVAATGCIPGKVSTPFPSQRPSRKLPT